MAIRTRWVLVLSLSLAAPSAYAQQSADSVARENFERGVAALEARQFDAALASLQQSYAIRAVPIIVYNLGLAYRGLGRNGEAIEALERYLAHPEPAADAAFLTAVRTELERLRSSAASVSVRFEPRDAEILVDGHRREPIAGAIWIDPGPHVIDVRAAGFHDARREITASAGQRLDVEIRAERFGASALEATLRVADWRTAEADRARRTQYALIGTGVVVTVVGGLVATVLQVVGNAARDDYVARCVTLTAQSPAGGCDSFRLEQQSRLANYEAGTYVGIGLSAVGIGVALAGGVTLLRMGDGRAPGRDVRLSFTGSAMTLEGRW